MSTSALSLGPLQVVAYGSPIVATTTITYGFMEKGYLGVVATTTSSGFATTSSPTSSVVGTSTLTLCALTNSPRCGHINGGHVALTIWSIHGVTRNPWVCWIF